MTREKYRGMLAKFFDFIGLTDNNSNTIEEHTKAFAKSEQERARLGVCDRSKVCIVPERKGRKGRNKPYDY